MSPHFVKTSPNPKCHGIEKKIQFSHSIKRVNVPFISIKFSLSRQVGSLYQSANTEGLRKGWMMYEWLYFRPEGKLLPHIDWNIHCCLPKTIMSVKQGRNDFPFLNGCNKDVWDESWLRARAAMLTWTWWIINDAYIWLCTQSNWL